MSETQETKEGPTHSSSAFASADRACAFGPSFFMGQLGRFVRDHCPSADEHLPGVGIRLADGRTLDLCHIIGVSPKWVMLAVFDDAGGPQEMAVEIVPFEIVHSVRIRRRHREGATVGFSQHHAPSVISAETLIQQTVHEAQKIRTP